MRVCRVTQPPRIPNLRCLSLGLSAGAYLFAAEGLVLAQGGQGTGGGGYNLLQTGNGMTLQSVAVVFPNAALDPSTQLQFEFGFSTK